MYYRSEVQHYLNLEFPQIFSLVPYRDLEYYLFEAWPIKLIGPPHQAEAERHQTVVPSFHR